MTCRTCGREVVRRHRHGEGAAIRYGRLVAEQERAMIRTLLRAARAQNHTPVTPAREVL